MHQQAAVPERTQVVESDRWNVAALYPSLDEWNKDFNEWKGQDGSVRWPHLTAFKGKLDQEARVLAFLIKNYLELDEHLGRLYTYAHLRHDEDVAQDLYKQAHIKITQLLHTFRQECSWIEPELLQISEEKINQYLQSDELKEYKIFLEKIIRFKPHTLSATEEKLLAAAGLALDASQRAFGAFDNADLKFPKIADESGNLHELSHGTYSTYMRSKDRVLRKNAFQTLHSGFLTYENTLCELINGQVQKHLFIAKARQFSSCLEAALFPYQIEPSVYHNLIATVRKNLPKLHRYMALRKQILGYDELHIYDLSVPLVANVDFSMPYEEAAQLVVESVLPLGENYQKLLRKGFFEDRWVDRYENLRKRSGAYSSGFYKSMPYILMNYHNNFQDVKTLAHEAGHSMHSLFSWKTQPYQDADYPIFVAEVASTFNEELLLAHLVKTTTEKDKKAYFINQEIEDLRNTFFRQVMFAEFELKIHEFAEQGIPLTPNLLKAEYKKLNRDYFGPAITIDDEIAIEWARVPHFYYNFYVYQYATGIAAACSLTKVVSQNGPENYLKFLSSGGSKYPLTLLELTGVDMRKPDAIAALIQRFEELTEELNTLLAEVAL
jgi:oligoendopeptidase F